MISRVARDWKAAMDTSSSPMSPVVFLPPLNIQLLPGTVHTSVSKDGFHPPLLSLAHQEANAIIPVHGSRDLVTFLLRAEPLGVDQVIFWLKSSML